MTSSSLTDQQRQDLAIFAGGDADEATAARAQLLLAEHEQAGEYFKTADEMICRLNQEMSCDTPDISSEPLADDRVRQLAGRIRARAGRRSWIQRPWAVAAALALVLTTAGVSHLVARNRETATAYRFPVGGSVGSKSTEPVIQRMRPTNQLRMGDEVGVILLPRQTEIIVAPFCSLRYRVGAIDVLAGEIFVNSPGFEVIAGQTRLRIAGQALVSVNQQAGSIVEVHSGTVTIQDPSGQVIREGQHAELNPFEVFTTTLAKPYWLRYGRERGQEIK